jgi:hypothetical protein
MWRNEDQGAGLKKGAVKSIQQERDFADYLDARRECGMGRMLANLALEPHNPFKPKARRVARKGFVIAIFTFVAFIAWFAWFNLIR